MNDNIFVVVWIFVHPSDKEDYRILYYFSAGVLSVVASVTVYITCICICIVPYSCTLRTAPTGAFRNCLNQLYFKLTGRGIGYSFQLAITASLYSIIDYCITSAQS